MCSGRQTMKDIPALIVVMMVAQALVNSPFDSATATDASGSIQGTITCTGNSNKHQVGFVFSAFLGLVPVYGNWEVSYVDDLGNTHAIIGYLGGGTIGQGNFNLEGTVTSDNVCGGSVPSSVSITGFCAPIGKLTLASGSDWRGEFKGNIECTQ